VSGISDFTPTYLQGCRSLILGHGVVLNVLDYSEKQMLLERRRNAENQQRQMQAQGQQLFRRGLRRDDGRLL